MTLLVHSSTGGLAMSVKVSSLLAAMTLLLTVGVAASDQSRRNDRFGARLKPTEEVPALSSVASGSFRAWIDDANQTISYELSYEGLEGAPLQAHIHVGQRGVNGGISVFLCGNAPTVPPESVPQPPACPPSPATITGVLSPANVVGPVPQGIELATTADEFDELVRMLRIGFTYANVHSSRFPGGEVRGQILSSQQHK
jgi:hypothetical protein